MEEDQPIAEPAKILSSLSIESFNSITAEMELSSDISSAIEELADPDRSIAWNRITKKKKIDIDDWLIKYLKQRLNWSDAFVNDIFSEIIEGPELG